MPDRKIAYEIKEHLGVINTGKSGWNKELNIVSWNGNDAKYDIRDWDEHHEKMSRGVTLSTWEMQKVVDLYLKNNTDKAVAKGREIEEQRRQRVEIARKASRNNDEEQPAEELVQEEREYEECAPAGFDVMDESTGDDYTPF